MLKLVFRIRRCYFDQIVSGEKTVEVRRYKHFWTVRANRAVDELNAGHLVVGVFICGRDRHDRLVTAVEAHSSPEAVLGRLPSLQGEQDIGSSWVWAFRLGSTFTDPPPNLKYCPAV